ncbi:MAG TPA: hypothetical protein VLV89_08155 [Candidatus Acidoferrum sp.]|nr:hypothetical protein [Candidatus Acidoferrum sp.]
MRKAIIPSLVAICLFLGGCAPVMTLFKLYDASVVTNDDQIVGDWEILTTDSDAKPTCCMVFAKSDDGYTVTIPDADDKEIWTSLAHLVKLGDSLFIDVAPKEEKYKETTRFPFPEIKVHTFGRIWIEKDKVRMELLDDDGMKGAMVKGKTRLTYVDGEDGLVVTSTTEQLQAFAKEHADDKDAFSFELNLQRKH